MKPEIKWGDTELTLIHDHYKDTFKYIRERERQRDWFFGFIIIFYGALFLGIQYPSQFSTIFTQVNTESVGINLSVLPLPALLSVSWTFVIFFSMRYCQIATAISRQYTYIHRLEDKLGAAVGDTEIFCREGKEYLNDYPPILKWAEVFYKVIIPFIIVIATISLIYLEYSLLRLPIPHKVYDAGIGLATIITFVIFRTVPLLSKATSNIRRKWSTSSVAKDNRTN
jgi:hypothetical protein